MAIGLYLYELEHGQLYNRQTNWNHRHFSTMSPMWKNISIEAKERKINDRGNAWGTGGYTFPEVKNERHWDIFSDDNMLNSDIFKKSFSFKNTNM